MYVLWRYSSIHNWVKKMGSQQQQMRSRPTGLIRRLVFLDELLSWGCLND